jgi:uncharacterized membrane protein
VKVRRGTGWTLQAKAFDSIQLAHSLTAISTGAYRLFDALYPLAHDDPARTAAAPLATSGVLVRWTGSAVVVQQIDVPALVGMARERDCSIIFRVRVGTTLSWGMTLAEVIGGEMSEDELCGAVTTGVERTFDQDPELPFRLLDDIIIAAAGSPMALLRMRTLLCRVAERSPRSRRPVVQERLRWIERTGSGAYPMIWGNA